jgi:hypothetical protein
MADDFSKVSDRKEQDGVGISKGTFDTLSVFFL